MCVGMTHPDEGYVKQVLQFRKSCSLCKCRLGSILGQEEYLEIAESLSCHLTSYWPEVKASMARVQSSSGFQVLVSGNNDRVKHALPEQKVAHPLRDDDVNFLWNVHRLDCALDDLNNRGKLH